MVYNAKATPVEGQNFPVIVDSKEYWVSRSVALCSLIAVTDEVGGVYIVAEKRGAGCPDENFKWCMPCGYIERNGETGQEGIAREVFEETGLEIGHERFEMVAVSYGHAPRYNITHFFVSLIEDMKVDDVTAKFNSSHSEPDEIAELKCIPLNELDNYEWAFGHRQLIDKLLKYGRVIPTV